MPVSQAESLNKALKAAHADVTLHVVADADHGVTTPDTVKLAGDFRDRHLR